MSFTVLANAQVETKNNKNVTKSYIVKTVSVESTAYKSYVATAYCLKGKMANGQRVSQGSVAVDPRIIPLGSTIDILGLGTYTARDTGGLIKNTRLDLWMPSCSQAIKFGRRTVKVRVISKPVRKIKT